MFRYFVESSLLFFMMTLTSIVSIQFLGTFVEVNDD